MTLNQKIKAQVVDQVSFRLAEQVDNKVYKQMHNYVGIKAEIKIWGQIRSMVGIIVYNQIYIQKIAHETRRLEL